MVNLSLESYGELDKPSFQKLKYGSYVTKQKLTELPVIEWGVGEAEYLEIG